MTLDTTDLKTRAGHPIVALKPARTGNIVLAICGGWHPYVVWWMDSDGNTFHGHYYQTRDEAMVDWNSRK